MNAVRALESGWVVQLTGDCTFGFCRAAVDMLGLGFCSMGGANHPAVWSYIPHQTEGELMYTVTFREMERAALSLLTANVDKECDFSRYLKHLRGQVGVKEFIESATFSRFTPSSPSTKLNATIMPDGANSRSRSLEKTRTSAPRISPVNFILLQSG